jgi:hypothetical protein
LFGGQRQSMITWPEPERSLASFRLAFELARHIRQAMREIPQQVG